MPGIDPRNTSRTMDFRSIYEHGFARVAACTAGTSRSPTPPRTRRRCCARRGNAPMRASPSRSSPSSPCPATRSRTCSCQDALLDGVEAALAAVVEGSADLTHAARRRRAAAAPQPDLQLRGGRPPRPDPRRRAEVVPADLPRVLRAPPARPRRRPARRDPDRRAPTCRSGPTCSSRPRTFPASSSTSRSARTSGSRSRRARRPRSPARPSCSTSPAARSPSGAPRTAS